MNGKYKVILTKKALKYYRQQDKVRRKQIENIINDLQAAPYSVPHVKPIKGSDFEDYRVQFGDFRLIYRVQNDKLIILVLKIGPRGDVYK